MTNIYVLGVGQRFPDHLTLEVLETMEMCDTIFTVLNKSAIDRLPHEIAAKCQSLEDLFRPDRPRKDNYVDVARTVVDAAADGSVVAWLTLGNPRIVDSIAELLVRLTANTDLTVELIPAVSSLDTVLIDVKHDPAEGILAIEATTMVLRQTPLHPAVATLIFQPGVFGTLDPRLTVKSEPVPLDGLRDHLLRYYAGDQPIAFVSSPAQREREATIIWTPIADMTSISSSSLLESTMFIPAVPSPNIQSESVSEGKLTP